MSDAPRALAHGLDTPFCSATGGYTVCTDKEDYAPDSTVHISGAGFAASADLTLRVTLSDGSVVSGDGSLEPWPKDYDSFFTDAEGAFQFDYILEGISGSYVVEVMDAEGVVLATHTFTDGRTIISATLDGATSLAVVPNASITALVEVTTFNGGGSNDWESTAWQIANGPGSLVCVDTPNHLGNGTNSESFQINAPAATGIYNAYFRAYDTDSCGSSQPSNLFQLPSAVIVDDTPPVITATVSGTQGNNGWYTSAVTVSYTVTDTDNLSGIDEAASDYTNDVLGSEGIGQGASAIACDLAGNCASASVSGIKIDLTGPTALLSVTAGTPGANGWYTSDVTVATTGGDAISGPVACTADQIQTTETAGALFNGECTNDAGLSTAAATLPVKLDKSGPTALLTVTAGTPGDNGWYTSDVTVATTGGDAISGPVACTADQIQTTETAGALFNGECTNDAGLSTAAATLPVKLDKSGPTALLTVTAGTLGNNGWYTSDVTVATTGGDTISGPVACTAEQYQTSETTGTDFNGECTNDAGLSTAAATLPVKLDKSGPTALLTVTAGTPGDNGWYTSDVTVATTGGDAISGPVACTADQIQTTETAGALFNGECTNDAGLSTAAATLPVKLDKSGPTALLTVTAGTLGNNGWYTSDVTVATTGGDTISGPVACTAAEQYQTSETTGTDFNGECTNDAGLSTAAATLPVKLDKSGPTALLTVTAGTLGNNGWYTSDVTVATTGGDAISGPVACTADQIQTTETAGALFNGECTNDAGLSTAAATLPVKLDQTPPTITGSASPEANVNGWNNTNVSVTFACSDALSLIDACLGDTVLTDEGAGQTVEGTATDLAGNVTNTVVGPINIDKTAPMSAEIVFPTDGTIYYLDSEWSVGCDPSSGICGTATDDGDVTSGVDYVQISIQQVSTGLYWDGDGFDSFDEVEFVADGSADWLNGFAFANFTDDGEYIVRARATDGAGNKEATDVMRFTINAIDIDRTWVTGGGKIGKGKPDWTFGGVAGYLDYGVGGQYQITDHRDGTKPRHYNEISYFGVLDENTVVFYASVEGEIGGIIVEITDNGSGGGKNKMKDEIHVYNENYEWLYGGYLDGGNFTIHTE